jgi:flagellar hook-associated protein FlgK
MDDNTFSKIIVGSFSGLKIIPGEEDIITAVSTERQGKNKYIYDVVFISLKDKKVIKEYKNTHSIAISKAGKQEIYFSSDGKAYKHDLENGALSLLKVQNKYLKNDTDINFVKGTDIGYISSPIDIFERYGVFLLTKDFKFSKRLPDINGRPNNYVLYKADH